MYLMKTSGTVQRKSGSLIHFAEKNNISYLVIGKDNDVHTNVHDKNMIEESDDSGYFLNQAQKESNDPGFHGSLPDQSVMGSVESELLCRYVGKPG